MSTTTASPALASVRAVDIDVLRVEGAFDPVAGAVLGLMEREGVALAEAVEAALREHPAADVSAHLDGRVSAHRLAAVCRELWGVDLVADEIATLGLAGLEPDDLMRAARLGQRYRLIGTATPHCATVELRRVTADHPLWSVTGSPPTVILRTAGGSRLRVAV